MKEIFKCSVGGRDLRLTEDNTRVFLFKEEPYNDMDYFQVDYPETEETLSVYRNPDICRYMAGILFRANSIVIPKNAARDSFYDTYGWNPPTLIRARPEPQEIDVWVELETERDIHKDGSWELDDD